jgi:hypothetical protein
MEITLSGKYASEHVWVQENHAPQHLPKFTGPNHAPDVYLLHPWQTLFLQISSKVVQMQDEFGLS